MPCWARVREYNYDQFECWGRPFWISLIQRQWVPLTQRPHKENFVCVCAHEEIEHRQNRCMLCNCLTSRVFLKPVKSLAVTKQTSPVWCSFTALLIIIWPAGNKPAPPPVKLCYPVHSVSIFQLSFQCLGILFFTFSRPVCLQLLFLHFCKEEIQLLECVACNTSQLRPHSLAERSTGYSTPHRLLSSPRLQAAFKWPLTGETRLIYRPEGENTSWVVEPWCVSGVWL